MCSTDIKDIDMKFSWIGDGVFNKSNGFCEAEGENLSPEQVRAIERNTISLHRRERAKALALARTYWARFKQSLKGTREDG
jgi:hypothetical protein